MSAETNGGLNAKIEKIAENKALVLGARVVSVTLAPMAVGIFFWLAQNVVELKIDVAAKYAALDSKIDVVLGLARSNDRQNDRQDDRMDRIENVIDRIDHR